MRVPICSRAGALRALGAAALALPLAGCGGIGFLHPHGPVAALQRDLFFEVTGWMLVVVLPAIVLVPFMAWRYRRSAQRSAYRPDWNFSWPVEIVLWGVPVLLVVILATLVVRKAVALDPYAPIASSQPPLEVEVIGLDYKWLFVYPQEKVAAIGVLPLPVGRSVHFRLTSGTVMQSFAIPALGSQIYAMAGMVTQLNLLADRPGVLLGQNTQFNGSGFQAQKFQARAMPPADFDRWLDQVRAAGRPLDAAAYAQVARPGQLADLQKHFGVDPAQGLVFSVVTPGLFDGVVAQSRPAPPPPHAGAAHAHP